MHTLLCTENTDMNLSVTDTSVDDSFAVIVDMAIQESRAVAGNPRDAAVIFDP